MIKALIALGIMKDITERLSVIVNASSKVSNKRAVYRKSLQLIRTRRNHPLYTFY